MPALDYIEWVFSKLLGGVRGHEAAIFCKGAAFEAFPEPTFIVSSPDCGASGTDMPFDYTQEGKELVPELTWPADANVKEWLLVVQDVDAPIPFPVTHGFYYGIPSSKISVMHADFDKDGPPNLLKGGFKYGANLRKAVYNGPRALKGHGPHRYYYQIIGLNVPLDMKTLSPIATRSEMVKAVQGKVAGWGLWVGVSERKFE